jgi:hypothetical protein
MPRKSRSYACACGCGGTTKGGQWLPGHDAKMISAILEAVGGHQSLRNLAEKHIGRPIEVEIER